MNDTAPVVYILHGDDEYRIAEFLHAMQAKLGDPTTAEMNLTRFEGPGLNLEELRASASAMPFLAPRRMVIVESIAKKYTRKEQYEKMLDLMDVLPQFTALVLVERTPRCMDPQICQRARRRDQSPGGCPAGRERAGCTPYGRTRSGQAAGLCELCPPGGH
jgi:hypothetical protein